MGYSAGGYGQLSLPSGVTIGDLFTAAGKPRPDKAYGAVKIDNDVWSTAIWDVCELDASVSIAGPGEPKTLTIVYGDSYHESLIVDSLTLLAQLGATGGIEFTGEDDAAWMFDLTAGKLTQHGAEKYYPTRPGEDNGTLLLSRREVRACIEFLSGARDSGDQQDLLTRLVQALNT